LWFRVNTFEIRIPPLRERRDDIRLLAHHLAGRFRPNIPPHAEVFTPDAVRTLYEHCWPGNVRELANVIEHATIISDELPISAEHLPSRFAARRLRAVCMAETPPQTLREMEIECIHAALERHDGNKPQAAEELGISLKTLYNKLNQAASLAKSA
jgi:two-component system NtrC family response regulator